MSRDLSVVGAGSSRTARIGAPRALAFGALAAAFALGVAAGPASAETAYGLSTAGGVSQLIRFDTASPGAASLVGLLVPTAGQQIVGIDFQPSSFSSASPTLLALGFDQATNVGQLYSVNLATGALTTFGTGQQLGTASTASASDFGFDVNPSSGGVRVVSATTTGTGQNNFRFNPTGTTLSIDSALAYAIGDAGLGVTPQVVAAAYTNNTPGTPTTTLYGFDFARGALVTIGGLNGSAAGGPNGGRLSTVSLFGASFAANRSVGFDVSPTSGTGFVSARNAQGQTVLYSIAGLGTTTVGAPVALGDFGAFNVTDVSVVPEPGSLVLLTFGLVAVAAAARRRTTG